jgi:hypothetical protein
MALIGNHLKSETAGFFIMLVAHDGPETGEMVQLIRECIG